MSTLPIVPTTLIAEKFASSGGHVIILERYSKRCVTSGWQNIATNNLEQARHLAAEKAGNNVGLVGKRDGLWFWDLDKPEVLTEYEGQFGILPTYKVRTVSGGLHVYFRQNEASWAMGNVSFSDADGEVFSARVDDRYVVSAGSWAYPNNDTALPLAQYTAIDPKAPILEAPQSLIAFIQSKSQHLSRQSPETPRNERGLVPHGAIHNYMLTQAGRLRAMGLSMDAIETALMELVHANCEPPIDDVKVATMAKSICNFPAGENKSLVLTGSTAQGAAVDAAVAETPAVFKQREYPTFPSWVMTGTSIYEGFVKPYCEVNSRIDYFMWAPAAALLLNYIGNKVSVPLKSWKPSIYLALIGEKTRAHKSSSVKDGMKFLEYAGALEMYSKEIKNADGRSVVWEAGSPEGLGTDMQRTNCRNAILFYDEFSALVQKAGIEGSGMKSSLLKMYESANFSNSIKSKKDAFTVAPNTYTASMIVCDTLEDFPKHWATFSNGAKGMDVRFTFLLQPEDMPEEKLETVVNYHEAALKTRALIDKAVNQGQFHFFDQTPLQAMLGKYDGRVETRAEKWALYFAIDLGLTEIDEDCVERGIAVAKYEHSVWQHLMMMEATTKLAVLQQSIIRTLTQAPNGVLPLRGKHGLMAKVKAHTYDTIEWGRGFHGKINDGSIALEGKGTKENPQLVRLLRGFDFEEEE